MAPKGTPAICTPHTSSLHRAASFFLLVLPEDVTDLVMVVHGSQLQSSLVVIVLSTKSTELWTRKNESADVRMASCSSAVKGGPTRFITGIHLSKGIMEHDGVTAPDRPLQASEVQGSHPSLVLQIQHLEAAARPKQNRHHFRMAKASCSMQRSTTEICFGVRSDRTPKDQDVLANLCKSKSRSIVQGSFTTLATVPHLVHVGAALQQIIH
mmetsp:Transcript_2183/g.3679  ORF Transcript_2183/g.3679 Transcript_2183/m.3679 type:complete len:211 (+) Transcript_2183:40-672(+)